MITTYLTGGLADLGLDPAFSLGLTDGVLLTCANYPDVASGLKLENDVPLIIHAEFTVTRPKGPDDDHIGIGFATATEPNPLVDLRIGPDWLELLAEDPKAAHILLGRALACCLDQLQERYSHAEWETTRANFIAAWDTAPPIAMLRIEEATTIKVRHKGQANLPRSRATEARARRRLASALLRDGVAPCQLLGPNAQEVCRNKIIPALDRTLKEFVAEWSEDAVLSVAEHLNDAVGERVRAEREFEMALSAPWGAHWQSLALDASDPAHQTRPLELLLELLAVQHPTGSISPDRFDTAEAADLAHLAIQVAVDLSSADRGLCALAVRVGRGGITDVIATPSLDAVQPGPAQARHSSVVQVDIGAYLDARRADQFRLRDQDEQQPSAAVRIDKERHSETTQFIPLSSAGLPGSLRRADGVMLDHYDTGLDGIRAVLGTAVSWMTDSDTVVLASRTELRDQAQAWSSLPVSQIGAALDRVILDPNELRKQGIHYWEQDRRRHRLTVQPLIPHNDQLIIIPWQIHATQNVYLGYLTEGRLPWYPEDVPDPVRIAFDNSRRVANRELERHATHVVANLQLAHKSNITKDQAVAVGLELPGEIDLLIADHLRSRLWVCEVKDLSTGFSPRTIRASINKFLDGEHYIDKLLARATAIEQSPRTAAQLVGGRPAPSPWRVIPLMITRNVEPAAFLKDVHITFTVVDDLAATLQSDSDPDPGQTPVGSLLIATSGDNHCAEYPPR